jgi:hypothetical protein
MSLLRRFRRRMALQEMGDATLGVIADLERSGLRVTRIAPERWKPQVSPVSSGRMSR